MLYSVIPLLSAVVGADGMGRSRHSRSRRHRPRQEDHANWIWIQSPEPPRNFYLNARKPFKLSSKPTRAILKCTADSKYKLYVNGRYVGKGPVRSGAGYTYYDTYDITDFLAKGDNVIAFLVHHAGENTYSYILGSPGLLCKVEIEESEERLVIATDGSWRVRRALDWTDAGMRMSDRLGFQEVYDCAERLEGWTEASFKERGWEDAVVVGTAPSMPWGELVEREIPPFREERILPQAVVGVFNSPERSKDTRPADTPEVMARAALAPLKTGSVKDASVLLSDTPDAAQVKTPRSDVGVVIILDFGREVFGNVEIGVSGSASGVIDLGYGELIEDGRVKPDRGEVRYTDRVLLKKGRLDWQGFESRAFRYMQIEFRWCSKPVDLEYVRVNQTTYPVQAGGTFECSDGLLNDIWRIGAYTTQLCMEDTFIDCPWRERAQWWADARIESRTAYYAFNDTKLLAQGLRQIASSQKPEGSVSGLYPSGEERLMPDFSLFWVFSILDYYAFSDDADLVRELYPKVRRLLGWFGGYVDDKGMLADVPGCLFIDWTDAEMKGNITALNCLYYQGLRVAAMLASVVGSQDEAESYVEASNQLKLAINKYLYLPKHGLYADCRMDGKLVEQYSRQTNIFAALFDLPDHYAKSTIYRQLLSGPMPDTTTPYSASYLLEALYAGDLHDEALDIIRKRWGPMVRAGATTFWEHFDQEDSLCHGWSTCPTRDLIAEYLGIKPILGSHRFSVTPRVGDLSWARGSVETITGPLKVEWKATRNYLLIDVEVPQGLKVDVYPPSQPTSRVSLNGKVQPSRFLTLGSGSHQIKVTATQPPKPAKLDESLAPMAIKHVELLDEASPLLRRRSRVEGRLRPRRKTPSQITGTMRTPVARDEEPEAVTEEIQGAVLPVEGEAAETAKAPSKRRSRRGGRRRGRSARPEEGKETTAGVPEDAGVQESAPAEPVPEPAGEAESAEDSETVKRSRRRSRRGGRRHSRSARASTEAGAEQPEVTETAEAPQAAPVDEPPAHPAPQTDVPRARRARAKKSPEPPVETSAAEASPSGEEQPEAARKRRRPSSRRGGTRRRSSSGPGPEGAEGAAEASEPPAEG